MTRAVQLVACAASASLWATFLLMWVCFASHWIGLPWLSSAAGGAFLAGYHAYLCLLAAGMVLLIGGGVLGLVSRNSRQLLA